MEQTYIIDENNKPIGVIGALAYGGGVGKIVGLQKSDGGLEWAKVGTIGEQTLFEEIICIASVYSDYVNNVTFTGDLDGSDNWEEICKVDPVGTPDAANNYPAFNFALSYGTTSGLIGTDYVNGWYVPSVAEVCEVSKNKDVIQNSLTIARGFIFGSESYQTSSQINDDFFYDSVFAVTFDDMDGYEDFCGYNSKRNGRVVFVMQALNAK